MQDITLGDKMPLSALERAVLGMPDIRCTRCGVAISMDTYMLPYQGELACSTCKNIMEIDLKAWGQGGIVRSKYLNPREDIGAEVWGRLTPLEQKTLLEAALAFGSEAYTASEFMALRTLESTSRRCYGTLKPGIKMPDWFGILDQLAKEPAFSIYSQAINYFRDVRNKVGHPDKISTRLDAESSYKMSVRLCAELVNRFLQKPATQSGTGSNAS